MGQADKLPKTLSASNREKTKSLKRRIQDDVRGPQKTAPFCLATMTVFNFLIPPITRMPDAFAKLLSEGLVDSYMKKEFDESRVLNWCRNVKTLVPMKNKGDGNCLLHAVSLFMWGVHDSMLLLRRLLYIALVQDTGQTQARWRKERGFLDEGIPDGFRLNSGQWESEWTNVVKSAEDQKDSGNNPNRLPYESLEEIHIFMLSNILRRPIVVLGDTVIRGLTGRTLAKNNFVGIYLPLLWKPSDCSKSPIVLGFAANHFVPLVAMEEDLATGLDSLSVEAVPVVSHTLTFIGVHFLMEEEEDRVSELLHDYLNITEVPVTQKSGLTLVLSAKLLVTKLPDRYNLMIDYVQAAERVFVGKEAILPSSQLQQQGSAGLTQTFHPGARGSNSNERGEFSRSNSYLASRERQQRALEHSPLSSGGSRKSSDEHINFNFEDQPKARVHQKQNIVPKLDKRKEMMEMEKLLREAKVAQFKELLPPPKKCKTPKCAFFGLEERDGFCSSCYQEFCNRQIAARKAAAATRMDSFEMSVTSTDCQFPACPYVASVYTYPYCHEHKKFSSHHRRSGQQPAGEGGSGAAAAKHRINDLNREHKPKSSSLTEQSSQPGSRDDSLLERQHSRSLEDMIGPEPTMHQLCTVPHCKLRGHPDQNFLCTQHYTMAQAQAHKDPTVVNKTAPLAPGMHSQLTHDNSSQTGRSMNIEDNQSVPTRSTPGDLMAKCKTATCDELGTEVFHGLCANCYIGLDMGEDTEVIEDRRPRHQEDKRVIDGSLKHTETSPHDDRKYSTMQEDKSCEYLSEKLTDVIRIGRDDESQNIESPPSSSSGEVKQATSTSESHEYHKCKNAACNRLAPIGGSGGFCSDCFSKERETAIVEPPAAEPTPLRVDPAPSIPGPSFSLSQFKGISLQSFPSVPIKQTYPNPPSTTAKGIAEPPPPTATEISQALKCATPLCSGIYVNLDKNNTGLCFSCLKAANKQTKNVIGEPTTKNAKQQANQVAGEPPSLNGDATQLLRRHSGGRRSGRNRHTIAFPPKGRSGMDSMDAKKCVSPLCDKSGSARWSGFCQECYEWMCLKFEQFQNRENESEEMTPCKNDSCEYFGTKETNGFCSHCHRKKTGKEVRFGAERRCSSGRSITPPPGARGDLCANPFCDQYGNKVNYNFCPTCFKVFDSCTGIQYSPPPTRRSFLPSSSAILDSEPYCWTPPPLDTTQGGATNHNHSIPTSFIPPDSFSSEVGTSFNPSASYFMSQTPSAEVVPPMAPKKPVDVTARYWEVMEGVESASRLGKSKCLVPSCRSFGNSKCKGYCNSCYVKHHVFV